MARMYHYFCLEFILSFFKCSVHFSLRFFFDRIKLHMRNEKQCIYIF